ncbi:MAG: hypothetical protein B7Y39_13200 [Bdellovibrio sp. 28-41-41]|nr:MAG: hypothetical protein B7Y39_13200 [Bdellovibrio sp. 28-41-41]
MAKSKVDFKNRKSKGQFVIEAVLLMSIGVMLLMGLKKWADEKQIFANMLTKPWGKISGMIENGAWGDPASTRSKHPHNGEKVATLQQE